MEILHFTNGINPLVMEQSIELAVSEAPAMVSQHIHGDSPLLLLAETEVRILLGESLRMVGAGVVQQMDGQICELKVGIVAAIDDEAEKPRLAGFIQYKPRLMTTGVASIGYAAVAKEHRNKGLFTQMLNELKSQYSVLTLDCPLELVPMYERLGFQADNAQGAHVGMSSGPMTGKNWMHDQEYLDEQPSYKRAKEEIRTLLGKRTRDAYAKREADTQTRIDEIHAMLAARGVKP
ncbi:GNAT family N-acetyltransferase [Pseudomonas sp. P9_2]|uniref:GNAT family N-acetyltransferase n=1 Tax=Pseudomonas sp. P9_2 TaxID=3043447 RepID=UPI002A36DE5A|nr:GNAT family N-acetyltransferase [Pseudomonas sp. P9_2]WPN53749.1 GNAT family N-acetyltransferase [Pseudomonas sp. P9_2]